LSTFIGNIEEGYWKERELYGYVKTKLPISDTISTISISSNLLASDTSTRKTTEMLGKLASALLVGEISRILQPHQTELPKIHYSTPLINITIARFKVNLENNISSQIISGESRVRMNLSNILERYNGFSRECGISLILFSKNPNHNNYTTLNAIASTVTDFKFELHNTLILENLTEPIILTFQSKVDLSILYQGNSTRNSSIACMYWDEIENRWSNNGCQLYRVIDNKTIQCACTHTTMFSTFIEQKSIAIPSLYYAQISFGILYTILSCLILTCLIIFRKEQPILSRLDTLDFLH
jgi:hypothetical protein